MPVFAIGMPGPFELGIILVILVMFFGLGKLPQVFDSLGKSIKAFKDAQRDEPRDVGPEPKKLAGDKVEDAHEVKSRDSVKR